jgi:hypothetical protein
MLRSSLVFRNALRNVLAFTVVAAALAASMPSGDAIADPRPRERLAFRTGPEMNGEFPGVPLQTIHTALLDRTSGAEVGVLDAVIFFTSIPQQEGDPFAGFAQAVATLPEGQITLQGALVPDDGPFQLAITGGTGAYRNAGGYVRVSVPAPNDESSRLVFHVTYG